MRCVGAVSLIVASDSSCVSRACRRRRHPAVVREMVSGGHHRDLAHIVALAPVKIFGHRQPARGEGRRK